MVRQRQRAAVHHQIHPAEGKQIEPGRGDDDVGVQGRARGERQAGLGEGVDPIGDDVELTLADGTEEIAVGSQAQSLIPRVVARGEVGVDVVTWGQPTLLPPSDPFAHGLRISLAQLINRRRQRDVLAARDRIGGTGGQVFAHPDGQIVACGRGEDVARRALQHGHVRTLRGERGSEGDGGGAAADQHDPLACHIECVGPVLRVDDRAREAFDAREIRRVGLVVAVVAGAAHQEPGGERDDFPGAGAFGLHSPVVVGRGPFGADRPMTEPDVPIDSGLGGGVAHIVEDVVAVGDRLLPSHGRNR